jgi:hypothetical protein
MFVKKPRDALKSILKTASARTSPTQTPNTQNLTALRDPDTGVITNNPAEVIAIVEKIETARLSPDPNIDPNGAFPWQDAIPSTPPPYTTHDHRQTHPCNL